MFLLYGILATALFTDFKECRIPNRLILIGYGIGAIYCILCRQLWYWSFLDSIVFLIMLFPFFLIGAFGGGDIKLLAIVALFTGLEEAVNIVITAVLLGAVCSVIKIICLFIKHKSFSISNLYIHFSLPILLGTILSIYGGIKWITF